MKQMHMQKEVESPEDAYMNIQWCEVMEARDIASRGEIINGERVRGNGCLFDLSYVFIVQRSRVNKGEMGREKEENKGEKCLKIISIFFF